MGQPHSSQHAAASAQHQHSSSSSVGPLAPFHEEQLKHLRTQLAQLAEALTLVDAANTEDNNGGSTNSDVDAPLRKAGRVVQAAKAHTASADAANAAFLLQPFANVHVAGYQLGDEALLQPLTLAPELQACSALSLLARHTALSVLDLSYNNLSPSIIQPLLQAVGALPALAVLRLSGNPLGSAAAMAASGKEATHDDIQELHLEEQSEGESHDSAVQTTAAAAQLGRWLATNPALQELALYQCGLNDYDVQALLRGLVGPARPTSSSPSSSSSSSLATLRLAGNPACTWRSVQLLLELVGAGGRNTALRVVELEGAPPATHVRFEYACTPDGHFRSGTTLVAPADARGASASVSEADLRALTPGEASRFRSRRRHLRNDLDGTRVMLPRLVAELKAILDARRTADGAAAAVAVASEGVTETSTVEEAEAAQQADADAPPATAEGESPAVNDTVDATAAGAGDHAASLLHTQRSTASAKSLTTPPLFLTNSHVSKTPQQRRAARFEAPDRIASVIAAAYAFRRHVHPMQVDTHAPTCSDVHARSTSSQYGSESTASTWYAHEGFVLRPNGLSKVLVAPVLSDSAAPRHNVLMTDVEDRPLQACWCTPRNATNAASYAGALHYHCVREGDIVRHNGGVTARVRRTPRKAKSETTARRGSVLPPLGGAAADTPAASDHVRSGGRAYLACCGTGHTCLSTAAIAGGTLRSQRMRTTLLTQSQRSHASSELRPLTSRGVELLSTTLTGTQSSTGRLGAFSRGGLLQRGASAPPAHEGGGESAPRTTMFGGAKTVHTTSNGISVALNYSPAAFFAEPHVPRAAGIEVEECM